MIISNICFRSRSERNKPAAPYLSRFDDFHTFCGFDSIGHITLGIVSMPLNIKDTISDKSIAILGTASKK